MSDRRSLSPRGSVKYARTFMIIASVVACVLLAFPTAVRAQVTTGNISGSVTDPQSGVLPGVTSKRFTHRPGRGTPESRSPTAAS
jgi:hypothetical protein